MHILSIDTASENCSVSILDNDTEIKHLISTNCNTHSVCLMPMIEQIFNETNLTLNDIDLFVCDKGPGSFTGIRIGVSTVKAFSDVTQKKCVGISSLKSLAYSVTSDVQNCYICSLIDAKHDNCYCGIFEKIDNNYYKIKDYFFDSISNIIEELKKINKKIIFCRKC